MAQINVVALSGNLGNPSRTAALAQEILSSFARQAEVQTHLISLATIGREAGLTHYRREATAAVEQALHLIESADVLVVATPVYRGSYAGLFKHVLDLVDQDALVDVPAILAATGGTERHALVLEHELRPLLSYFRAQTVPTAIYATEAAFAEHTLVAPEVLSRLTLAVEQALRLVPVAKSRAPAKTTTLRSVALS